MRRVSWGVVRDCTIDAGIPARFSGKSDLGYHRSVNLERRVFWVVLFTLGMAAVEAAVVVYLRELYCPAGFRFPVLDFSAEGPAGRIGLVELLREAATMVMLAAVSMLAGRTRWQRWALFMLSFGLWDLLYYVWLEVLLGWPASLGTWDLVFLIPVPWTGPVLAPCLVALALVGAAAAFLKWEERDLGSFLRPLDWTLEVVAGLTVILAFTANARACLVRAEGEMIFPWLVFSTGLGLGVAVFLGALRRALR